MKKNGYNTSPEKLNIKLCIYSFGAMITKFDPQLQNWKEGISYDGSADYVVTFRQCNAFLHCSETQKPPKTFKAIKQETVNQ